MTLRHEITTAVPAVHKGCDSVGHGCHRSGSIVREAKGNRIHIHISEISFHSLPFLSLFLLLPFCLLAFPPLLCLLTPLKTPKLPITLHFLCFHNCFGNVWREPEGHGLLTRAMLVGLEIYVRCWDRTRAVGLYPRQSQHMTVAIAKV